MARSILIPQRTYQGAFGPFEVDDIPSGSAGCILTLSRANGIWPGTLDDAALEVVVDYLYSGIWNEVARFKAPGGLLRGFGGQPLLVWSCAVTWPSENGQLLIPEAGRALIDVPQPLNTGGEFRWLSA